MPLGAGLRDGSVLDGVPVVTTFGVNFIKVKHTVKYINLYLFLFKNFTDLRETKRENKHSLIHWLFLVCALTGG